jgi:hypothetical protein
MKSMPFIPEEDREWYKSKKSNNRRKELPIPTSRVHHCKLGNFSANSTNSCLMVYERNLKLQSNTTKTQKVIEKSAKAQEKWLNKQLFAELSEGEELPPRRIVRQLLIQESDTSESNADAQQPKRRKMIVPRKTKPKLEKDKKSKTRNRKATKEKSMRFNGRMKKKPSKKL